MGVLVITAQPVATHIRPVEGRPVPRARPLLIEVAGLAGAGKTEIARALARLEPTVRARPRVPGTWHLATIPALIPTFVGLHWPFRRVLTKEVKRILRVEALYHYARRATGGGTLVFDEGPVYFLARMLVFGGENVRTLGFQRWWHRALAQWALMLDAVVWLEVPDAVLATRIHTRSQRHPLQGARDDEVGEFLRAYRDAFRQVLDGLRVAGLRLWTVDTSRQSADDAARGLLARLADLRHS